ncbi:proliferating cell nuclear antigen [Syncephalis pseudoplumigaleata]|uniref:DNA sliding clamp PCNA n=1 Tax=Syncephalis pseudoplumigaleata TaxID=1712513 RepID=A0A4P9Z0Z5_9FUNG|nr:proliferating cell nuclear antigen [Syncephalis pseudoplumigaleata]|eukprot:RKP26143.1 proliferating cell nuclear antigen [Syncephalis pseudoplumigaleata]
MFEARLNQGAVLKKLVDAVRDIVSEGNFDCNENGLALQAMDSAHVALVAMLLRPDAFEPYRCDRNMSLGISLKSLGTILRCASNDDIITLRAEDTADQLALTFESPQSDKVSEYVLNLMDIDSEHLGIPDTSYDTVIHMSSAEFQRICRDLQQLSDSVTIDASKEGIKFTATGQLGSGQVMLRQNMNVDREEDATVIEMQQPVQLTFAVKYLSMFAKTTPLCNRVTLCLSKDVPLLLEYKIDEIGYIRYYLAPKVDSE